MLIRLDRGERRNVGCDEDGGVVVLPINLYQKAVEFLVRFLGLAKLDIVVDFNNDYLVGKEGVTHFNSILPFTRRSWKF